MFTPFNNKSVGAYGIPSTVNLKHVKPEVSGMIKQINSKPPEVNLPNFVNYYADLAGCGFWRIKWPEYLLNITNKAAVTSLAQMVFDANWYKNIKALKIQRQATNIQKKFFEDLNKLKKDFKYKIIYEIDDVVFGDDIPEYNHQKQAFMDKEINSNILYIMQNVDEITVTTEYLKSYYKNKTGHNKITVIPNYIPNFWAGRFYSESKLSQNFDKNRKKPRVLYAGSGTHCKHPSILKNISDDFSHVVEDIIKARKDFTFVWKGTFPQEVKPYILSGEMEFHKWSSLLYMPQDIYNLNCNVTFACLSENEFNKSKSNIKMLESGALGLPGTFQDIEPYKNAAFKFKSGADLIDSLKTLTKNHSNYLSHCRQSFNFTNNMWLEDHLDEHFDVYNFDWGSVERNKNSELIKNNLDQKI